MNYAIVTKPIEEYVPSEKIGSTKYWYRVEIKRDEENITALESMKEGEPHEEDFSNLMKAYIDQLKSTKTEAIIAYDSSSSVNHFYMGEIEAWLDKATRVGLMNSLTIEEGAGHETTTLYLNGIALVLPVSDAIAMLNELELYALDCYRQTEAHKLAILEMSTAQEIEEYDITAGYPEAPHFSVGE